MNQRASWNFELGVLIAVLLGLAYVTVCIQLTPALLTVDAYYHAAVTQFIRDKGWFLDRFPWTQMSVMKEAYSDKDLLLHVLALPFTFVTSDPRWVSKFTSMLLGFSFLGVLVYLFRRFLSPLPAALALITVFLSPLFVTYYSDFRPGTLASIFTLLGIYFAVEKRKYPLFAVALLYSWAHLSAFTLVFFVGLCELVRYLRDREYDLRLVAYAAAGTALGLIAHPNFPANLLTIYINGFLTPFYALGGSNISFAMELYAVSSKMALLTNFAVFAVFWGMMWAAWAYRPRISLHTMVFGAAANLYYLLSLLSNRFWFPAVPLAVLTAASFTRDLFDRLEQTQPQNTRKIARAAVLLWAVMAVPLTVSCVKGLETRLKYKNDFSRTYERAAEWMSKNIPPGETIYHSSWGESPYLICLNPRDRYLVVLDPIYMYYWSKDVYALYQDLSEGRPNLDPYKALTEVFKAKYGITAKKAGFYQLIRNDSRFRPLYDTDDLLIFTLEPQKPQKAELAGTKKRAK